MSTITLIVAYVKRDLSVLQGLFLTRIILKSLRIEFRLSTIALIVAYINAIRLLKYAALFTQISQMNANETFV